MKLNLKKLFLLAFLTNTAVLSAMEMEKQGNLNLPIRLVINNNTNNTLEITKTADPSESSLQTIESHGTVIKDYDFSAVGAYRQLNRYFREQGSSIMYRISIRLNNAQEPYYIVDLARMVPEIGGSVLLTTGRRSIKADPTQFYNIIVNINGNNENDFVGTTISASAGPHKL
jgi:hypothetical protein